MQHDNLRYLLGHAADRVLTPSNPNKPITSRLFRLQQGAAAHAPSPARADSLNAAADTPVATASTPGAHDDAAALEKSRATQQAATPAAQAPAGGHVGACGAQCDAASDTHAQTGGMPSNTRGVMQANSGRRTERDVPAAAQWLSEREEAAHGSPLAYEAPARAAPSTDVLVNRESPVQPHQNRQHAPLAAAGERHDSPAHHPADSVQQRQASPQHVSGSQGSRAHEAGAPSHVAAQRSHGSHDSGRHADVQAQHTAAGAQAVSADAAQRNEARTSKPTSAAAAAAATAPAALPVATGGQRASPVATGRSDAPFDASSSHQHPGDSQDVRAQAAAAAHRRRAESLRASQEAALDTRPAQAAAGHSGALQSAPPSPQGNGAAHAQARQSPEDPAPGGSVPWPASESWRGVGRAAAPPQNQRELTETRVASGGAHASADQSGSLTDFPASAAAMVSAQLHANGQLGHAAPQQGAAPSADAARCGGSIDGGAPARFSSAHQQVLLSGSAVNGTPPQNASAGVQQELQPCHEQAGLQDVKAEATQSVHPANDVHNGVQQANGDVGDGSVVDGRCFDLCSPPRDACA